MKQKMTFSIIPIGTTLYKMHKGKLVEFEIQAFNIIQNKNEENYIQYTAYTNQMSGKYVFVQPLEGKFEKAKCIFGIEHVNTLHETKEECIEAFLKELGVRAEVRITI